MKKGIGTTILAVLVVGGVFLFSSLEKEPEELLYEETKNEDLKESVLVLDLNKQKSQVTIAFVRMEQPGFIAVHNVINGMLNQVVEVSSYLDKGEHSSVSIPVDNVQVGKVDIGGEFPSFEELAVVMYIDDGDKGFNPFLDEKYELQGKKVGKYVSTGKDVEQYVLDRKKPDVNIRIAQEVAYTDEGFIPREITISKGETVRFINKSSQLMWVASDSHPMHDIFPEFDQFGVSAFGEVFDYTFKDVGEWAFHDHVNASMVGMVKVE